MAAPKKSMLIALCFGCVFAGLTLGLDHLETLSSTLVSFLFPGILCAMALSGNAHAFHLWVAALANFALYFALPWPVIGLGRKILSRRM
jgi:hypothetical protein